MVTVLLPGSGGRWGRFSDGALKGLHGHENSSCFKMHGRGCPTGRG